MDNEELLELIMSYKKSTAFMVAYDMGIFKQLYKNKLDIATLSKKMGANEKHVYLLLQYLKSLMLVEEQNREWSLSNELESSYANLTSLDMIIHHERNIYQKWMLPDQLEQSLKEKDGARNFDKSGFTASEKEIYDNAMYGSNLKILSLRLLRELRGSESPSILEIGRSEGSVLLAMKKIGLSFHGYVMEDSQKPGRFDVILLYNSIHYFNEEKWHNMIKQFEWLLEENGRVFIIDYFYNQENPFLYNILLDWVTHGGTNYITKESIKDSLKNTSLRWEKSIYINSTNSTIIVLSRMKERL